MTPIDVRVNIVTDAFNKSQIEARDHGNGEVLLVRGGSFLATTRSQTHAPIRDSIEFDLDGLSEAVEHTWVITMRRQISWRIRTNLPNAPTRCTVTSQVHELVVPSYRIGDEILVHEGDRVSVELSPPGAFQLVRRVVPVGCDPELVWMLEIESSAGPDISDGQEAMRMVNCVICMSRQRNALLLPCRHMPCCTMCGSMLQECPICRTDVQEMVPVWLSRAEVPLIGERLTRGETQSMQIAHMTRP